MATSEHRRQHGGGRGTVALLIGAVLLVGVGSSGVVGAAVATSLTDYLATP
jgi:D-arabinose 5-phosphate isomerase GutQ